MNLFRKKLTKWQKYKYKMLLRNIYKCKTFIDTDNCMSWIDLVRDLPGAAKKRLKARVSQVRAVIRKRGMAQFDIKPGVMHVHPKMWSDLLDDQEDSKCN